MTNEEVMQMMTDMGLHEGGIENWVMDNAWVLVVNKAIEKEREACAKLIAKLTEMLEIQQKLHETAIDMLKPAIEAEREACAKACEDVYTGEEASCDWPTPEMCATAIRARGQA
jgi:hypothetical protein